MADSQQDLQTDLALRIARLERELSRLVRLSERPITVQQLHVGELHVETLHLDQPSYRLDNLTVREVSGALNLGNNFTSLPRMKKGVLEPEESDPAEQEEASTGSSSGEGDPARESSDEASNPEEVDAMTDWKARKTGPGVRYTLE
ncbi:hypothetical protein [Gorillibacterium sp. CAU 1737]|uniref:hypothetical protein n=1 Tax=Gorillibacterium sp. CAU 1737 TaxID=3140362 RepID=UPI003260F087